MYLHNLSSLSNGLINIDYDFTYVKLQIIAFVTKIFELNKKKNDNQRKKKVKTKPNPNLTAFTPSSLLSLPLFKLLSLPV